MDCKTVAGWAVKSLPPELGLLVDCCRANFAGQNPDRFDVDQDINWERFGALTRRHRVEGLAWHGLHRLGVPLPEESAAHLLAAARKIAEDGLRAALTSQHLRNGFANQGIPLLFLKGLAVGHLAYGDAFRKSASDIDVLVPANRVAEAATNLRALGYRAISPASDDLDTIKRWHHLSKESTWVDGSGGLCVELHTALTDHQDLLSQLGIDSPVQQVTVMPAITLATLAHDELIAYLCVHGASSAWFRLKWIADLAGLLTGASEAELAHLLLRARSLGAGRAADQAFLLACFLFPLLPVDASLARSLRRDRTTMWLARRSLGQMLAPEPTARRLGTLTIHLTQLALVPGWRSGWRELRRQLSQRSQTRRLLNLA